MRTAVVQMRSTPDVDANLASAERLTARAAERGAEFVMLPEAFAFIGPDAQKQEITEPLPDGGPHPRALSAPCSRSTACTCCSADSTNAPTSRARPTTPACTSIRTGAIVSCYRKIHLFDVDLADGTRLNESDRTIAGKDVVVTPTPFGPLGLTHLLRRALSGAVSATRRQGRYRADGAVGVYVVDRQRSLARAAARARDRMPGVRAGAGAMGPPPRQPNLVWPRVDRRPVGLRRSRSAATAMASRSPTSIRRSSRERATRLPSLEAPAL